MSFDAKSLERKSSWKGRTVVAFCPKTGDILGVASSTDKCVEQAEKHKKYYCLHIFLPITEKGDHPDDAKLRSWDDGWNGGE